MSTSLAGIRVVEITGGPAVSYCTKLLAGLGADVVKIEPPAGDICRYAGPFPGDRPDPEASGLFLHLNTGKRSITLDLDQESDRARVRGLLEGADVLVEGFVPGYLATLGLGYAELARTHPSLVVTSITPFGQDGPYAGYAGPEIVVYALGGYMMITGSPEREPLKAYSSQVLFQAGLQGAYGTLAALTGRDVDGRGDLVDVSAMEAAAFLLGSVAQVCGVTGDVQVRNGTRLIGLEPRYFYPSTLRPCRDGYVHAHTNVRHPDMMAVLMDEPRLAALDLLAQAAANADEIDALMDRWLALHDRHDVVARAQELRVPFTEVFTPDEVLADPHHAERGAFVELDHPVAGRMKFPGPAVRFSVTPWQVSRAPLLGEHNDEVSSGWSVGSSVDEERQPTDYSLLTTHSRSLEGNAAGGPPRHRGSKPLCGIRIIDFTTAVAGPTATAILGDLGAEVIKIEALNGRGPDPAGVGPLRVGMPDRPYNRVIAFNERNRSKQSVVIDLGRPEGREQFLRLAAVSDAVIENFSPRVMGNLGLDYPDLAAVRPDIILVSMPAFGKTGPYRSRISYGPGIDAMSGLSHLTGYPDGPPMKPGNFYCDQNAGLLAATSLLAALRHRRRTGEGQYVECAMIEGEMQLVAEALLDYQLNGRVQRRTGNRHPWQAPHGVYPCAGRDAWVAIAVESDVQFVALCNVMALPELTADPRFATMSARHANQDALDPLVASWTGVRDHVEVQRVLQQAGVPAGAALNAAELLSDPQVRARGSFEYVAYPDLPVPFPHSRVAFKFAGRRTEIEQHAPGFGEHNDAVLGNLLGGSAEALARLRQAGVVGDVPATRGSRQ